MTFKVQVGPPQIAIHQAMTVLLTESDGQIRWPSDKGLYFFDTRLVSHWTVYANGTEWELLNGGAQTRVTIHSEFPGKPGIAGWMEKLMQPPIVRYLYKKELRNLAEYVRSKAVLANAT